MSEETSRQGSARHPLRVAREERGYTMRSLAEAAGMGKSGYNRINDYEHGRHIPAVIVATALAPLLGFASAEEVRRLCREWQQKQPSPSSTGLLVPARRSAGTAD